MSAASTEYLERDQALGYIVTHLYEMTNEQLENIVAKMKDSDIEDVRVR